MTNNNDRLHTGELYLPNDPELEKRQFGYLDQLYDFNQTRPSELTKRQILLSKMFAEIGPNCYIEQPFTVTLVDTMSTLARGFTPILT